MEAPEAAWVAMVMDRVHALEQCADGQRKELAELRARDDSFAPGFNVTSSYFFWAFVDWRITPETWAKKLDAKFSDFTICCTHTGEHINPPPRHPIVQLIGVINGQQHSEATMSRLLDTCLGEGRNGPGRIELTRVGGVVGAVIACADKWAHRDRDGSPEPPDLDLFMEREFADDLEGELRAFLVSDVLDHLTDPGCQRGIDRLRDYAEDIGLPTASAAFL